MAVVSSLFWAKKAALLLLAATSINASQAPDLTSRIIIGNGPDGAAANRLSNDPFANGGVERLPVDKAVEGAYIVSLKGGSSIAGRHIPSAHERFHKRAADEDVTYDVRREFHDADLFYGLSLTLHDGEDVEKLKALPEVLQVWPVTEILPPTPLGYESVDFAKRESVASRNVTRGKDYKIDYNLKLAGVEHLHSHGFKGKGVKVAVVDTGVDYNHPALGGGFGPGKKITFGRSYINDGIGGPNDPLATCASGGHGTHVAGTIIGEDPSDYGFGLLGVAPEVELGMYRIFPCVGSTGSDLVLAGLLDAADDGADIISLSLGSNSGWAVENPFERVITLLKERNIVTIIAQGNYGFAGPYWTGSPAISNDAIAVASTNAARYPTTYKFKDNKGGSFTYGSLWPLTTTLKAYTPPDDAEGLFSSIYGCSYQVLDAAVAELERRGWQPQETVILFKRGGQCGDTANSGAAAQYGFHATLFWAGEEQVNPEDNFFGSVVGLTASLYVNAVDGPSIHKSLLADPLGYQLVFSSTRFTPLDLGGTPNAVSNFSTWGAAWEVDRQKPDISAPGHLILSSWPLEDGGYAIISGTSMATPFAAGAYALLKSAYPNLSVDELRSTFASTANPTRWWADNRVIHSTLGQGAGLINVWKAYNSGALLNETRIVLGTTAKATRSFTIKNTLGRSKTFSITHEPAGLNERVPYPEAPREEWYTLGWISKAVYADVVFHTPTEFTLGAGETATVSFTVTAPDVDERYIPSYSGYITLTSGRDVYRASYYGVPYKFSDAAELFEQTKRDGVTLPALGVLNPNIGAPTIGSPYISFNNAEGRFFEVLFRTWQPFSAWRVDLIHHNTTFKPTIEAFPGVTFDNLTTSDFEVKEDWGGVQSLGYVGREGNFAPIDGWATIGGGFRDPTSGEVLTLAYPPGDYRLVLRVLRLDQDPTDPKSWDSWLSGIAHLEDEFPNS